MPDMAPNLGTGFLGSLLVDGTCFGSTFAGGIVGNLVASAGYDLLKLPSRNLARWVRQHYVAGDPAPNHDLLRAARHAEALAAVVTCELALYYHDVVPSLWEATLVRDTRSFVRRVTAAARRIPLVRSDDREPGPP